MLVQRMNGETDKQYIARLEGKLSKKESVSKSPRIVSTVYYPKGTLDGAKVDQRLAWQSTGLQAGMPAKWVSLTASKAKWIRENMEESIPSESLEKCEFYNLLVEFLETELPAFTRENVASGTITLNRYQESDPTMLKWLNSTSSTKKAKKVKKVKREVPIDVE